LVLVALLVICVVQAVQINTLKQKVASVFAQPAPVQGSAPAAVPTQAVPSDNGP
jgi:hypothetical protein